MTGKLRLNGFIGWLLIAALFLTACGGTPASPGAGGSTNTSPTSPPSTSPTEAPPAAAAGVTATPPTDGEEGAAEPTATTATETEPTESTVGETATTPAEGEPTEATVGETATAPAEGEPTEAAPGETVTVPAEGEPTEAATAAETEAAPGETATAPAPAGGAAPGNYGNLKGRIVVDGSSTVEPIMIVAAEEFARLTNRGVSVTVGGAGTGDGFQRFCAGETDISDASRPIEQEEVDACAANGIEFIELPVAVDGLTVVANPQNTWAECLTVEELKNMWQGGPGRRGTTNNWSQIREGFPNQPLRLFGPGDESGTYDYWIEAILDDGEIRRTYTPSANDRVIAQGVAGGGPGALGFFGFAYYANSGGRLKALQVDGGDGCVAPTLETIRGGEYSPLSRPLFIYVKTASAEKPEVQGFVQYLLSQQFYPLIEERVGYVTLTPAQYQGVYRRFQAGTTGSLQLQEGTTLDDYAR